MWDSAYARPGGPDDPDASPGALFRVPLPVTEAGERALADQPIADASALGACRPKGMWGIMAVPTPLEFVEDGSSILLRIEELDTVRTIHMDGGEAAAAQPRTPLGYSAGRWEDDTLVIETTRLGDQGPVDPFLLRRPIAWIPLGPDARLVERFTPGDDGRLLYSILIDGPERLTHPVEQKRSWIARPDEQVLPFDCNEARPTLP